MPTMLRTSPKIREIAQKILGTPVTKETKESQKYEHDMALQVLREEKRKAR
jgi:hypothetical protein